MTKIMIAGHQRKIRAEQNAPAAGDAVRQQRIFRPQKRFLILTEHNISAAERKQRIAAFPYCIGNMCALFIGTTVVSEMFCIIIEPFPSGTDHKAAPFLCMIDLHVGRLEYG